MDTYVPYFQRLFSRYSPFLVNGKSTLALIFRSNVSRVISLQTLLSLHISLLLDTRSYHEHVGSLEGCSGRGFQSRVERMFASGIERKRGVVFEYRRRYWLRPASEPYLRSREDFLHYIYVTNRDCTIVDARSLVTSIVNRAICQLAAIKRKL